MHKYVISSETLTMIRELLSKDSREGKWIRKEILNLIDADVKVLEEKTAEFKNHSSYIYGTKVYVRK